MGSGAVGPTLVDVREHRFQLGVVGALTLGLSVARRPGLVAAVAAVTMAPVLPMAFRRFVAPELREPVAVEDARLPAFARVAGGLGLLAAAAGAASGSRASQAALVAAGGLCIYGSATGYCVPCHVLTSLERAGAVELDPPLVCTLVL